MESLKSYLKTADMTQVELAKKANLGVVQLNHYIHGRRLPGARSLLKLATATGMTIERLLRDVE